MTKMHSSVRKNKNQQLKALLKKPATMDRITEAWRLCKELGLGPGMTAKIAVWVRTKAAP